MTEIQLIEKFQCPGCVVGSDTKCGKFRRSEAPPGSFRCESHVAGTHMLGIGRFALGFPKGFCKLGEQEQFQVRFWLKGHPVWNHLNLPAWRVMHEGWLFVRTFMPRVNRSVVDVLPEHTEVPSFTLPIRVDDFIETIDP